MKKKKNRKICYKTTTSAQLYFSLFNLIYSIPWGTLKIIFPFNIFRFFIHILNDFADKKKTRNILSMKLLDVDDIIIIVVGSFSFCLLIVFFFWQCAFVNFWITETMHGFIRFVEKSPSSYLYMNNSGLRMMMMMIFGYSYS